MVNASSGKISHLYQTYIQQSMKPNSWGGQNITDKEFSIMMSEEKLLDFSKNKGSFLNAK